MTEESARVVRIERTFAASAEDVFDALTTSEVMRRWLWRASPSPRAVSDQAVKDD